MDLPVLTARRFAAPVYASILSATRRVRETIGSRRICASCTRVGTSTIERYESSEEPNYFIPLDVALDLDDAAQSPILLSAFADAQGYDLVKRGNDCTLFDFKELNVLAVKELSSALLAIAEALQDGKITVNEARNILAHNHNVKDIIRALDTACHAITTGAA